MKHSEVRKDYSKDRINVGDCPENPLTFLHDWLEEALEQSVDANAMVLGTVASSGQPSSRIVLARKVDDRGLSFYTNYESRKGAEMAHHNLVSLNFFWPHLERQVRVEGKVEKLSATESDLYFASRPRESQLGAWASDQSQPLDDRSTIEQRLDVLREKYKDQDVPRPPHWGGYLVRPTYLEFWQGRPSRLHDRVSYTANNQSWELKLLFP